MVFYLIHFLLFLFGVAGLAPCFLNNRVSMLETKIKA